MRQQVTCGNCGGQDANGIYTQRHIRNTSLLLCSDCDTREDLRLPVNASMDQPFDFDALPISEHLADKMFKARDFS